MHKVALLAQVIAWQTLHAINYLLPAIMQADAKWGMQHQNVHGVCSMLNSLYVLI